MKNEITKEEFCAIMHRLAQGPAPEKQLADLLGAGHRSIWNWTGGERPISGPVARLAKTLDFLKQNEPEMYQSVLDLLNDKD